VRDTPAVTLMVITYNHERYVDECLRAVAAQTFTDLEVIVIDDASTDGTVERIRPWLDRLPFATRLLVNERNLGICATRNRAIAATSGSFLCSVSGDDFYEPEKIASQHAVISTLDESVAMVFSNMRVVDDDGTPRGLWFTDGRPPAEGHIFERLVEGNFIPAPTAMTRRAAVLSVGGYDESLYYEDYDMWLRLADRYEFRFVPGDLVNYRWTGTSASRNPRSAARMLESRARLLMKWSDRDPRTAAIVRDRAWRNARRALRLRPGARPRDAARGRRAAPGRVPACPRRRDRRAWQRPRRPRRARRARPAQAPAPRARLNGARGRATGSAGARRDRPGGAARSCFHNPTCDGTDH